MGSQAYIRLALVPEFFNIPSHGVFWLTFGSRCELRFKGLVAIFFDEILRRI